MLADPVPLVKGILNALAMYSISQSPAPRFCGAPPPLHLPPWLALQRRKEEEAARVAAEAKAAAEAARLAELEEARRAAREEAAKLRKMSKK